MQNKIRQVFQNNINKKVLVTFITAGFPLLESTVPVCRALFEEGVDIIEIGIPFSDPIADGPTIQYSNNVALHNGMNLSLLIKQVVELRKYSDKPIVLMGSFNPILQFGVDNFCKEAKNADINGFIFPDLPIEVYAEQYADIFKQNQLASIFLVTPETSDERVKLISSLTEGFIYLVSSSAITGGELKIDQEKINYFKRVKSLVAPKPILVGFGVNSKDIFHQICEYTDGAIIGSALIRSLEKGNTHAVEASVSARNFIKEYMLKARE